MDLKILFFLNNLVGKYGLSELVVLFFAEYLGYLLFIAFLIFVAVKVIQEKSYKIFWGKVVAVSLIAAIASRFLVTEIIRFLYFRERPLNVFSDITGLIEKNSASFPSGHAAFMFAFAAALYFFNKKWGVVFFIAGAVTGVARIMAGIHYPTDILGGLGVGIAVAWLVLTFLKKFYKVISD